jgi:hypothetical protein
MRLHHWFFLSFFLFCLWGSREALWLGEGSCILLSCFPFSTSVSSLCESLLCSVCGCGLSHLLAKVRSFGMHSCLLAPDLVVPGWEHWHASWLHLLPHCLQCYKQTIHLQGLSSDPPRCETFPHNITIKSRGMTRRAFGSAALIAPSGPWVPRGTRERPARAGNLFLLAL